jgi:hypothetical protein
MYEVKTACKQEKIGVANSNSAEETVDRRSDTASLKDRFCASSQIAVFA